MGRGKETLQQLHAVLPGAGQFTVAFENGQLLLFTRTAVPKLDDVFDGVVLRTCDLDEFHGLFLKIVIVSDDG